MDDPSRISRSFAGSGIVRGNSAAFKLRRDAALRLKCNRSAYNGAKPNRGHINGERKVHSFRPVLMASVAALCLVTTAQADDRGHGALASLAERGTAYASAYTTAPSDSFHAAGVPLLGGILAGAGHAAIGI